MNWTDYVANPRGWALKKYMSEVLRERYQQNEAIVERVGTAIQTDRDAQGFNKLIADVYESGYLKAVNDYKEQLAKLGFAVNVIPEKS